MRKTVIILSIFALVASGCKTKTTSIRPIVESGFSSKLFDPPAIKDAALFISDLRHVSNLEICESPFETEYKKITIHRKVKLYGSDDDYFLVECDWEGGDGASYPWKYQFVLTAEGKHIKTFSAQRYAFVQIIPNQNPFLLIVFGTAKGNGAHEIYKVSAGTLENVYDGYDVQTYDAHDDGNFYEPHELDLKIKDYNNDGFNDIAFVGKIVLTEGLTKDGFWFAGDTINCIDDNGDTITYSADNVFEKIPIEFICLYDKKTGHFKAKENYQDILEQKRTMLKVICFNETDT